MAVLNVRIIEDSEKQFEKFESECRYIKMINIRSNIISKQF